MGPGGEPPTGADYVVTGVVAPDCTGEYVEDGTYGGKPKYRRLDSAWWIWWWAAMGFWMISSTPAAHDPEWYRISSIITGTYEPGTGSIGIATVAAA